MNTYLKELCKLAGIDETIKQTYYIGNERKEEVHPKYELLASHVGRRTFICNALSLGIPAQVVMKLRNPPYTRSNSGGSSRLQRGVKMPHFDVHSFRKRMKKWTFWTFERLFSAA